MCPLDSRREKNRLAVRKYKQTAKGRLRQRSADNRYKHTEHGRLVCLAHSRKRKERRRGLDSSFTYQDHQFVLELFNDQCFNCGSIESLCIDHHHPLSNENPLTRQNAVVLCDGCNTRKYNKHPREFYTHAQLLELEQRYGIATA